VLNISRKKDKLSGDAFLQKKRRKNKLTFVQKNMKRKKEELKKNYRLKHKQRNSTVKK
jgi:hypothetical protein